MLPLWIPPGCRLAVACFFLLAFRVTAQLSDNPLANPQKFIIEAEDFNFGGGQYHQSADTMPYYGGHYRGDAAVAGVDYQCEAGLPSDEYRWEETPNVAIAAKNDPAQRDRGTWTVQQNYAIGWAGPGQWFNYSRAIPHGGYRVWASAYSNDTATNAIRGRLQRVVGPANTTNQVVEDLGIFEGAGSGSWNTNTLVRLQGGWDGSLLELGNYSSLPTTLRYVPISGDLDYLLLEFVVFIDPATSLKALVNQEGQVVIQVTLGLDRPRALQGALELKGGETMWTDLTSDFSRPHVVAEGSPHRFFRLDHD